MTIIDFNAKSSKWHCQDKSAFKGNVIDNITSYFGLCQLIKELTHILDTSSSCLYLIFTSLPNLIIHSIVHSSLHQNCHHTQDTLNSTYSTKFKLITLLLICKKFRITKMLMLDLYKKQWTHFNWTRAFSNTSVNVKVNIFNNTILNILCNFIPHEILTCNDKDPRWFNKKNKRNNWRKKNASKAYRSSNIVLKNRLRNLQVHLNSSVDCAKEKFYNKIVSKLNDTQKKC